MHGRTIVSGSNARSTAKRNARRCHEIDHPPPPCQIIPHLLTAQSSASYCVNRVRYVSRQFMQNYGDNSAEVYDWFTFKTDRIQICHEGQVLLVFCGLNRRKELISLIENITRQLCDLILSDLYLLNYCRVSKSTVKPYENLKALFSSFSK